MSFKANVPIVDSALNSEPTKALNWLHLSDLHDCKPKTGWDTKRVTDSLCKDLRKMQEEQVYDQI
jgi:hypothetical protein